MILLKRVLQCSLFACAMNTFALIFWQYSQVFSFELSRHAEDMMHFHSAALGGSMVSSLVLGIVYAMVLNPHGRY